MQWAIPEADRLNMEFALNVDFLYYAIWTSGYAIHTENKKVKL